MSKRWDRDKNAEVFRPNVDAFLEDIISVCDKHQMSIGHEDYHGAFIIEPFNERCVK